MPDGSDVPDSVLRHHLELAIGLFHDKDTESPSDAFALSLVRECGTVRTTGSVASTTAPRSMYYSKSQKVDQEQRGRSLLISTSREPHAET